MNEFTSEELLSSNGKDGNPAYVAFHGKVYDVSKSRLWPKGLHMNRHASGKDLSADISAAPHGTEVFERYPQVGVLKQEPSEGLRPLPSFLGGLLKRFPTARRHPHPVMVHFPIALLTASSLFAVLHVLFKKPTFESTSFYLLLLGSIASPFAIITGLLTWWVNYGLKLSRLSEGKLSSPYFFFWKHPCCLRSSWPEAFLSPLLYLILMVILTPVG
jgi:predicted heme/steroid binding protein